MNILHVSAECSPFVKIGGLADVVGSLPSELKRLRGSDVRVILPYYKAIPKQYRDKTEDVINFNIQFNSEKDVYVGVKQLKKGNILYYFIDNEFYFGSRENVYSYGDEGTRFAFFQVAVLEALPRLGFDPDIIHVHDWHTGMVPMLMKARFPNLHAKTILTIHNLAYQGIFPLEDYKLFDIKYDPKMEFEGFLNFLKCGIAQADMVTTVSPKYAEEILTDYFGYGMQNLLRSRGTHLQGILNGIDYSEFSPQTDRLIKHNYDIETAEEGKLANKIALFKQLGVDFSSDKPVIGLISRLVSQKGIDLIKRVFDEMLGIDDFYFIVLGSGEEQYETYFRGLEERYPNKVKATIGYSNKLAHMIYAGVDMFLMPSKFEPCGLGQIIALKYGTIPIVRETGGLVDTVQPYNEYDKLGNGFSFTNFNAHDMMHVIRYAMHIFYHNPKSWNIIVKHAMESDYSWTQSAKEYRKLYKQLMK
ncbi:MAG: glycogen synthase GlgA [Bacilli bacterium]|nr:glycogen synthase GlgA [Bacilli bacterium]MBN2876675.1 glycogen synthase GlgA [Bacilli bacterium]